MGGESMPWQATDVFTRLLHPLGQPVQVIDEGQAATFRGSELPPLLGGIVEDLDAGKTLGGERTGGWLPSGRNKLGNEGGRRCWHTVTVHEDAPFLLGKPRSLGVLTRKEKNAGMFKP